MKISICDADKVKESRIDLRKELDQLKLSQSTESTTVDQLIYIY